MASQCLEEKLKLNLNMNKTLSLKPIERLSEKTEAYSEPCQLSKIDALQKKMVNR